MTTPLPGRLWQCVGTHLFIWDKKTDPVYIEVVHFHVASAETVKSALSIFARHGVPVVLMSDNGPQFVSSLLKDFASEHGKGEWAPRSYLVRTEDGLLRRNRTHLRASQCPPLDPTNREDNDSDSADQPAAEPDATYVTSKDWICDLKGFLDCN